MEQTRTKLPAVFITGASSGIGNACLRRLLGASFEVIAGVRATADAESLVREFGSRIHPVIMDVTDQESIAAAAVLVEDITGSAGLAGLVNNAGIGIFAPLECLPLADLRRQFEVNVFGQIAVTQAMLPALRRGRGRIVSIGSIGDRITLPFVGPLCASKHALASLTAALRQELFPWGVHVCLIEPASIKTPAVDKLAADSEAFIARMTTEEANRYAGMFREFTSRAVRQEQSGSPPSVVAETVLKALTDRKPRTRYLCGKDAHLLAFLAWFLPESLFDLLRRKLFGIPNRI